MQIVKTRQEKEIGQEGTLFGSGVGYSVMFLSISITFRNPEIYFLERFWNHAAPQALVDW